MYFMRRTCAFDSLASILLTAALDDRNYYLFLEQAENSFSSFFLKFVETGVTTELYKERFLLLKPLYESTESVTSIQNLAFVTSYDATDNSTDLWTKLFEAHPSTFHTSVCEICNGDGEHNYTIQIDHAVIPQHGFKALQKALDFHPVIYNKPCICGFQCTETSVGNNHIFVELGTRTHYDAPPLRTRLNNFPVELTLDCKYRLVGVINEQEDHFTSYCRRASGYWQEYDDVRSLIRQCKPEEEIHPIGEIYIKKIPANMNTDK
ncbi:uncharacterized protein LOC107038517 [Diachasma alloeum]|uniref:uncharacterized protein LOC107038517 n=1 Tax=Diachasma alloeum TaxID=454923 RepID=UPI0007382ED8|nr:uncharacterized protein LOC107038517 [Diachasma alloeum]